MYPGKFPVIRPGSVSTTSPLFPSEQERGKFDRNRNCTMFPSADQGDHDGADPGARSLLQAVVREEVLSGRDVFSVSKTPAEERTLAYLEPCYDLMDDIYKGEDSGGLNVLVLVPTRELATQVREEAEKLGEVGGYKAASCFRSGTAPINFNKEQLAAISTATILIATPCKLKDLINSGQVDLSLVFYLVLDGADKMVQMGLEPQVRDIVKRVPRKRQSLMFSESLGPAVRKLSKEILCNPWSPQLMFESSSRAPVMHRTSQVKTEARAMKRSAGSPPVGQKPKMTLSIAQAEARKSVKNSPSKSKSRSQLSPAPAVPVIIPIIPRTRAGVLSTPVQTAERSAAEKEECLAYFGLCPVSKAEEIRAAMKAAETEVVVRVLRSGTKVAKQPGRIVTTTSTWYPPSLTSPQSPVKSKGPLPEDGKIIKNPINLRDSPGPFNFEVRFIRSSNVSRKSDWVYSDQYKKLYVDLNTWVSVLFNMEDFTDSQTDFRVRLTAVVIEDFTCSTTFLPFHLIQLAGSSLSSYQQDSQGRHAVIFPISSTAPTLRKIKFTRLSSDLGKEVKVVFSLEDWEGEVVGRRVFSVKIRAEVGGEIPIIEL